jgi:hypothetical protein
MMELELDVSGGGTFCANDIDLNCWGSMTEDCRGIFKTGVDEEGGAKCVKGMFEPGIREGVDCNWSVGEEAETFFLCCCN